MNTAINVALGVTVALAVSVALALGSAKLSHSMTPEPVPVKVAEQPAPVVAKVASYTVPKDDICVDVEKLAKTVMGLRQRNIPMSKLMHTLHGDIALGLVRAAYATPRYQVPENQASAAEDFANAAASNCYNAQEPQP